MSDSDLHSVECKQEDNLFERGPQYEKIVRWFPSVEQAYHAIHYFESSTNTKYNVLYKRNGRSRVTFGEDDIPYIIERTTKLECQYGKDRNKTYNAKRRSIKGKIPKNKQYVRIQPSIKTGCSAYIDIIDVTKFPQYKSISWRKSHKDVASCALREALRLKGNEVIKEPASRVSFPPPDAHHGHDIGKAHDPGVVRALDPRIIDKIDELVEEGLISMKEIQKHLRKFVYEEIFHNQEAPSKSHKRFFPTKKIICDHYIKSCIKQNKVVVEGENLNVLIDDWDSSSKTDNVFHQYTANLAESKSNETPTSQAISKNRTEHCLSQSTRNFCEAIVSDLVEAYNTFCPPKEADNCTFSDVRVAPTPQLIMGRIFDLLDKIKQVANEIGNNETLQQTEFSLQQVLDGLLEIASDSNNISNDKPVSKKRKLITDKIEIHPINVTVISNSNEDMAIGKDIANISPLLECTDAEFACVEVITDDPLDETVLLNGPYHVTASELHAVKCNLLKSKLMAMDEVINSFLWQLCLTNDHIMFVDTHMSKNLFQGFVDNGLWENASLSEKKYIFLPLQKSENKWILLVVDLENQTLSCFNAKHSNTSDDIDDTYEEVFALIQSLMCMKFNFDLLSMDSRANVDEVFSCKNCDSAVQICMLAKALATDSFFIRSADACYEDVFEFVAGNCLTDTCNSKAFCKLCKGDGNGDEGWIQCARCSQWFHVPCVGLTFDEAESGVYFVCPEISQAS